MSFFSWEIVGNELLLTKDSEVVFPSAIEVFQAEFTDKRQFKNFTIEKKPSENFPSIKFSRFPAELLIIIQNDKLHREKSQVLVVCKINAEKIVVDFLEKKTDHIILESTWLPFPEDFSVTVKELFDSLNISPGLPLTLKQYFSLILQCRKSRLPFEDLTAFSAGRIACELSPALTEITYFQGKLYPYQEQGFKWLNMIAGENLGCILGDEMGLGKTIQIIALIAAETSRQNLP
jgi:SNF2 family DNA or RNA helicase